MSALSISKAIKIQAGQLPAWQAVLKEEYFEKLRQVLNRKNKAVVNARPSSNKTGSDILRGYEIGELVYKLYKKAGK